MLTLGIPVILWNIHWQSTDFDQVSAHAVPEQLTVVVAVYTEDDVRFYQDPQNVITEAVRLAEREADGDASIYRCRATILPITASHDYAAP